MVEVSIKERIYIFDSSVFITLNTINRDSIHLPQEVWDKLDELMDEGKIISHRYVYDEVVIAKSTKPDKVSQWLEPKKHHFPKETSDQVLLMAQVIQEFPKLIEIANEKEQADPWLVAMAMDKNNIETDKTFVLVTQEKQTKTTNLPAACRHFKVESIPLAEFFHEVGISFGISISEPAATNSAVIPALAD